MQVLAQEIVVEIDPDARFLVAGAGTTLDFNGLAAAYTSHVGDRHALLAIDHRAANRIC